MATQLQKKLRVLCLHGFRTNTKVMESQTRTLRKALGDKADFLFLDGPFEAEGPTDASIERAHGKDAPFYEWCRIKSAEEELSENLNAATALTSTNKEWRFKYVGLDRTFEFLDEQLQKHGPFDVVVGFSQGATVATSLSMQYLQHNVRWWNLLVCISGVPVRGRELQHLFEKPDGEPILVPFPSIHIMGKKDPLYTESIKLAAMYEPSPEGSTLPKIVLEHDGGHRFPSDAHNPGFYDHLASIIEQHCGIAPVSKIYVEHVKSTDDVKRFFACTRSSRRRAKRHEELHRHFTLAPAPFTRPMMALTPTSSPAKKLRVLCLHGFRTNVQVMQTQTQGIRDALGENAEFVFVNAPFPSRGDTDEVIKKRYGADTIFYEWWQARYLEKEEIADLSAEPYPADTEDTWNLYFEDIDTAFEYMDEQIQKHGPFDIALGFSQGSIMLTLLSMLYLKKQDVQPWKMCICVCGVRVHGINVRELFVTDEGEPVLVPYPSIHILGKLDTLYDESKALSDMYEDHPKGSPMRKLILETDSGHKFPTPSRHKDFYQELAHTILQFFEHTTKSSVARL